MIFLDKRSGTNANWRGTMRDSLIFAGIFLVLTIVFVASWHTTPSAGEQNASISGVESGMDFSRSYGISDTKFLEMAVHTTSTPTPPSIDSPPQPSPLPVLPEPIQEVGIGDVGAEQPTPPERITTTVYPAGSLEALICSLPWPCWEAIEVAACESGRGMDGNLDGTYATNLWDDSGQGVYGLFQIALPWPHAALLEQYGDWDDPWANAQAAYQLYAESGNSWYPHWACWP